MKYLKDFKKFIEIINFYKLNKYYLFIILYLVNFFFEAVNLILIVPFLKIISDGTYVAKYKFYYQSTVNLSQNDLIFLSVLIFMAINILRFFYFIFSSNIQKKFLSVVRETVASKLFSSYTKKNYVFREYKKVMFHNPNPNPNPILLNLGQSWSILLNLGQSC